MTALIPLPLPSWREVYPAGPPDVRLDIGPWCPLDGCRLEPEVIGWFCPRCGAAWSFRGTAGQWLVGGADLVARLMVEDAAEDEGLMPAERRTTCRLCRAWASPAHLDGGGHQAAVAAAVATTRRRRVDRAAATTIGVGAVSVAGYVAGQATGDWPTLPDVWLWTIAAVVGGAALLLLVAAALAGWYERRRWPAGKLLDSPEVSDGARCAEVAA